MNLIIFLYFLFIYIILCSYIEYFGYKNNCKYGTPFLVSFFLSPLIGWIFVKLSIIYTKYQNQQNLIFNELRLLKNNTFYIVERRKSDSEIDSSNCFMSDSMLAVVDWIKNHRDNKRDFYWCVIEIEIDNKDGGRLVKVFDLNGNEIN